MEEELLLGSDDRRRRSPTAGARRVPPLMDAWPPLEGPADDAGPVGGAAGWRVTRRTPPPAESTGGMRPRPSATVVAEANSLEPPLATRGSVSAIAHSPRRIGAPDQRRRGISLLALAAAAVIVISVLGLAALDTERHHWPLVGTGIMGEAGQAPATSPTERPG
jgi:hypothetical protein